MKKKKLEPIACKQEANEPLIITKYNALLYKLVKDQNGKNK